MFFIYFLTSTPSRRAVCFWTLPRRGLAFRTSRNRYCLGFLWRVLLVSKPRVMWFCNAARFSPFSNGIIYLFLPSLQFFRNTTPESFILKWKQRNSCFLLFIICGNLNSHLPENMLSDYWFLQFLIVHQFENANRWNINRDHPWDPNITCSLNCITLFGAPWCAFQSVHRQNNILDARIVAASSFDLL